MNRLEEIKARLKEIRTAAMNSATSSDELNRLTIEAENLGVEKDELEARAAKHDTARAIASGSLATRSVAWYNPNGETRQQFDENMKPSEVIATPEYRSAFFKYMQGKELTGIEQRAFTSAADSGGAAIPTAVYQEVLKKLQQTLSLFPHVTVLQLPGAVKVPVEVGEGAAGWVEELGDIEENGTGLASVSLGGFTLAKLVSVSIAAASMSAPAFEQYLTSIIIEKMQVELEKAILNGTGTGQPTGIFAGVTWTPNTNAFTYDGTTGLTYDDVLKPLAALGSGYLPNAAWAMSSATLYQHVAKIVTNDKHSIFVPDSVEGFAGKIMGKPVILNDYMPAGKILFGNFRYYFLNFSQPIMLEKSRESGFTKATVDYRAVAVVDAKPALSAAFVKLEPVA